MKRSEKNNDKGEIKCQRRTYGLNNSNTHSTSELNGKKQNGATTKKKKKTKVE